MRRPLSPWPTVALLAIAVCTFVQAAVSPSVTLSWQDNADNEENFRISRSVDAGASWVLRDGAVPASTAPVGTRVQYVDTLVAHGVTYDYRVRAENFNGVSAWSESVRVTVPAMGQPPADPSNPAAALSRGWLVNVSARAMARSDDATVIPGFTVAGGPTPVLIRAVGPSLARFGVPGTLADPRFEVIDQQTKAVVASNDDWTDTPEMRAAFAATFAFSLPAGSKDAAVLITLPPGQYTVVVRGANNTTGVVLVETYEAP